MTELQDSSHSETAAHPADAPAHELPGASAWLGIAAIFLIVVASFWLVIHPEWVLWFGRWGYVGAFAICFIASATVILPAPGIFVVIAMSPALNPIMLGFASGLGSACGELTGYFVGVSGRAIVPPGRLAQFERLHGLVDKYGAPVVGLLAAFPFPLFDFVGIIAGVLRMNVFVFWVAVVIGNTVKYIVMILVGASALSVLRNLIR